MVEYDVFLSVTSASHAVAISVMSVAYTHSYIAHDDVAGIYGQRVVFQADAVARSRLPGDSDTVIVDAERRFQFDSPVYGEEHGTGTFLFDSVS